VKKQTSYIVIAFLFGIILTQYFLDKKHSTAKLDSLGLTQVLEENRNIEKIQGTAVPQQQPQLKMQLLEAKKMEPQKIKIIDSAAKNNQESIEAPKKQVVGLTLDEQNISKLEQNLNNLESAVIMRREDRGWRVKYLLNNNPMESVGLQNNDLVLYDLMNKARNQSAEQENLVSRLENVFANLER
jgi:hypothetical protein